MTHHSTVALPWNPDMSQYKHKRQTSMPRAGYELAIPATKRPKTYTFDLAATGIGVFVVTVLIFHVNKVITKMCVAHC
jgi:hypothetical protein